VTALRSLLGFLHVDGIIAANFSIALRALSPGASAASRRCRVTCRQ
jgi:hypothetical protein